MVWAWCTKPSTVSAAFGIMRATPPARTLLEVLSVAGAPISREVAAHATRQEPEVFAKAASLLRVMAMARSGGMADLDLIDCYHDFEGRFRDIRRCGDYC